MHFALGDLDCLDLLCLKCQLLKTRTKKDCLCPANLEYMRQVMRGLQSIVLNCNWHVKSLLISSSLFHSSFNRRLVIYQRFMNQIEFYFSLD